ncbi:MAG: phytoene desaturase family protein [Candidatus Eiseniibacteriota bacterium]
MSARFDVVVIGAGANGLVAATVLARSGLKVSLLERADAPGGQGRAVEFAPGFRAAPLGLDPGWLPPSVARAAGLEGLERASGDCALSVAIEPGRFLTLAREPGRAAEAIRAHSAADAAKWPAFTARLAALTGFLGTLYQVPAPDIDAQAPGELLGLLDLGRKFRALGRTHMVELLRTLPMSVWELVDDWFENPSLKAAVAAGGILDHQQGPRSGGTGFVLLHHLVGTPAGSVRGRLPWRDGPEAFTDAALRAAQAAGVAIRTSAQVARIRVAQDAVEGVTLVGGEEIAAGAVLSTADPAQTLLDWVDPVWLDPDFLNAVRNIRHRGCTAFVLHALDGPPGLSGLSQEALAGTVSFSGNLVAMERAADSAKYGAISRDPHVELTVPTLSQPALAPEGRHVVVARAQYAPYRLRPSAGWTAADREVLSNTVNAAIERYAPGFGSRVLHRVVWSPHDLEERFGLHEGAASQGELGLDQILFMRPVAGYGRHATPIAGLYLGGAGTHPGPGILGGAGHLAAQRLMRDRRGQGKGQGASTS